MSKKTKITEEKQEAEIPAEAAETVAAEAAKEEAVVAEAVAAEPAELTHKQISKEKLLTPKQKKIRLAKRILLLHVGIILMSCSVYFFQTPNNFTLGGVAGIAILLASVIQHPFFSQAVIMAIINVLLIIIGLVFLGKECTILTIYCSLFYTALIALLEVVLPLPCPLTEMGGKPGQPFMEMCYAVLLFGTGGALIFNCRASSGGTDIIALIMKKYTKMNVGMALMIIDLIVICASIVQFKSMDIALFSFLGLFARTFLLDGVIENIGKTKYITIITTNPGEIGNYILEVIDHSFTQYDAQGGYTHEKKYVLITVCKRSEALKIKTKVKQIDPSSFVIVTDAKEILGKGFGDTI